MTENAFISRVFPRPPLLDEPPKRRRIWILDVLIAYLLFTVASIPISVITSPIISVYMIRNIDLNSFVFDFDRLDINSFVEFFKNVYTTVMTLLEQMPAWISLISLFVFAFITLTVIICRVKIEKGTFYSLGMKKNGLIKNYALGLFIGFVIFSAATGLGLLTGGLEFAGFSVSGVSDIIYIVLFFFGYIVQGMAEEVLCRGFLLTSITRRHSVLTATVINSLFFALLHIVNPGISLLAFINLFLFGVFASLVMIKTDNIWMVSAIHAVWNFTQGNIFGVRVSGSAYAPSVMRIVSTGSRFINGGNFGMEGGICVTAVLLIGIVIFAVIKPMNKAAEKVDV